MYNSTTYLPLLGNNIVAEGIDSSFGVTQGRHSSPNLYSFLVDDMPHCTNELNNDDFLKFNDVLQLADDTAILAITLLSLRDKLIASFNYSESRYQIVNISKTVFCNFSSNPTTDPIILSSKLFVKSVEKEGHKYLGTIFLPTNNIDEIILKNFNERIGNSA